MRLSHVLSCLSARSNSFLDIGGLKLLNGEFVVAVRELIANPDEEVNVGRIAHLAELRVEIYFVFRLLINQNLVERSF